MSEQTALIEYRNLTLCVLFNYTAGTKGLTDSDFGNPLTPDDSEEIEIIEVSLAGQCLDELLTEEQFEEIAEKLYAREVL